MKKTYQAPETISVVLTNHTAIMQASASGLDGFEGNGGKTKGRSADSRRGGFWDDEDY